MGVCITGAVSAVRELLKVSTLQKIPMRLSTLGSSAFSVMGNWCRARPHNTDVMRPQVHDKDVRK